MLFNSTIFALFLPTVFALYWFLDRPSVRPQNVLLLFASYLFYGWWDWRFLSLIVFSSALDFAIGLALGMTEAPARRRWLLAASLLANLGVLGFFKYWSFFRHSLDAALGQLGLPPTGATFAVILPVGISFYTFQTLSYTIDVFRRRIAPTRDALAFFAFVSFFPQLVAGPIERAQRLLPQFLSRRRLDLAQASDGLRQMLWGLTKKVVVADNLAPLADAAFNHWAQQDATVLLLGMVAFTIQIYGDFSGYSDIAIGCSRLFGIDLMRNFATPFFARDIAEFWRRWHISLSTWFRDYLYIPLGGNRVGRLRHARNILATFAISGLWHGADWTYVIWGLLHGLYALPAALAGRHRRHHDTVAHQRLVPSARELAQMATTFLMVLLAFVLFRSPTLADAVGFLNRLANGPRTLPQLDHAFVLASAMLGVEWLQREKAHGLAIAHLPRLARWLIYDLLLAVLFWYAHTTYAPFIYFQF